MAIDAQTIRGMNYVGSWAPNPVGHWRFYDAARVELELGMMASIGVNAVRVWLSYAVWAVEGSGMAAKLTDLLDRAAARGIVVMLVVWDSVGATPSGTPYDDLAGWVANPGPAKIADPGFLPDADLYVEAVAAAAAASAAEVIWDVMNEPDHVPLAWVLHHHVLIKDLAPASWTTVGYFFAASAAQTAALVDVISYHPYGIYRRNVSVPTQTARAIAAAHGDKPILATELGFPGGGGQRYEDVLDYVRVEGVGFFLFQAMIGDHPLFPWKHGTGFFFVDGTIRDLEGVRAFQSLAKAQGFAATDYPHVNDGTGPLWVPYAPMPSGFGAPENAAFLVDFAQKYGVEQPLLQDALDFYRDLIGWTYASFFLAAVLDEAAMAAPIEAIEQMLIAAGQADWASAETLLHNLALLAGILIEAEGLAEPKSRPPEVLSAGVTPNPFPGGALRIEAVAWDPDGLADVLAVGALVFSPAGTYLFGIPLFHEDSGIHALEVPSLQPFDPGTELALTFVVVDTIGSLGLLGPLLVTGT
jgi:hypothetical protein